MKRIWLAICLPALLPAVLAAQTPQQVNAVRKAAWAKDVATIDDLIRDLRAQTPAPTPRLLEALSWAARGASFAAQWDKAESYAREAYDGSRKLLEGRALDADRNLAIALGAAIEVLGQARDARGARGGAVEFLRAERERYKGTSIETRIQKNVLLLTLEGKPAPAVAAAQWLAAAGKTPDQLKGQVVLLFFWAHWCGDCKAQKPALDRLAAEFGSRGLTIVGPTQYYGYVARGAPATPEQELAYLRGDYQKAHPVPDWMSVPISGENFLNFGVSTTPTLMLIDRQGIVRLYHPGTLPYETLAARISPLLRPRS